MRDDLLVLDLDGTILDGTSRLDPALAAAARVAPPPEAGGLLALLAELLPEHFGRTRT